MINKFNTQTINNKHQNSELLFTIVHPSKDRLNIKKLYDVVLQLLFFTIAVVTLLIGVVIDAVLVSSSKKPGRLLSIRG